LATLGSGPGRKAGVQLVRRPILIHGYQNSPKVSAGARIAESLGGFRCWQPPPYSTASNHLRQSPPTLLAYLS
jgi:hypothetical protein